MRLTFNYDNILDYIYKKLSLKKGTLVLFHPYQFKESCRYYHNDTECYGIIVGYKRPNYRIRFIKYSIGFYSGEHPYIYHTEYNIPRERIIEVL